MPFLKVPKLTREVIPNDALKALPSASPDIKIGRRERLILILLYDSTVRVSELLSMNISPDLWKKRKGNDCCNHR